MSIFNYCPNCQSENFIFERDYRLECFDCHFIFFRNPAAAVALILNCGNEVLFTIRNKDPEKGKLDLPGGFVDDDETAELALVREVREELGLHLESDKLTYFASQPNHYPYKGIVYKTLDLVFEYTVESKISNFDLDDEIQDIVWIPKNKINLADIGFTSIRKFMMMYL